MANFNNSNVSAPYSTSPGLFSTATQNMVIQGSLQSVTNLPLTANHGDTYVNGGVLYMWMHGSWANLGALRGPMGHSGPYVPPKEIVESKLVWKGISVTLYSEEDIKALFFNQYALSREDMALFQMTYPDEFKAFRERWAEKWAIERAKEEFDEWELDYYEKRPRRNYS